MFARSPSLFPLPASLFPRPTMHPLRPAFFERPTLDVARDLLGALLVREQHGGPRLVGRVVETEGYRQDDPAFRGWRVFDEATGLVKPEGRGRDLFGPPGRAYVYLVYDRHWMLNVVTEPEGVAGAVLLRAVEPLAGLQDMWTRREAAKKDRDLANGPGKLTQAFGLDGAHHDQPLTTPPLYLAAPEDAFAWPVARSARIGLRHGIDLPWRFFAENHPCVSSGTPSDQVRKRGNRR